MSGFIETAEDIGKTIRESRKAQGLSQASLAARSSVSRKFIVDLERGDHERGEIGKALRVLSALHLGMVPVKLPHFTPDLAAGAAQRKQSDDRLKALLLANAQAYRSDGSIKELAMKNIEKMRQTVKGEQAQGWLDEWKHLVLAGADAIEDLAHRDDERAKDLRQVAPFAGALSQSQRQAALLRAGEYV